MRVGIIQSSFIPWRGYFDFIASVDRFIFYDDVQYSKNGWRNRNQIRTAQGLQWLTVPVRHQSLTQLIQDTQIDERSDWRSRHLTVWKKEYASAPYLSDVLVILGDMGRGIDETISQLNIRLIRSICDYLKIDTDLCLSSNYPVNGSKTERLINLLKGLGATAYLSGPSADDYLDKELFKKSGIRLEYKSYDYKPYAQIGDGFEGNVSILDLIANCGAEAKNLIQSQSQNQIVVRI